MPNDDLTRLSIAEAAAMVRDRRVSPVELTQAAIAQAEHLQPSINSWITLMGDQALAQARQQEAAIARGDSPGLLSGIPIGIKDNIEVGGVRATVGTKVLADNIAEEDAHVVTLCKQAGAIILGKENLEEFAAGATSNNPHYGAVHNPWNLDHIPGGSSGGGGANVAAEVTFASLGTDLGGSVRLPGTFCGVVGLKQTYGRVSQRGLMVTSFNGDHIGPMTRTVADAALMLQATAGYDPLDPTTVPVPVPDYLASIQGGVAGMRMGIPTNHFFDSVDSEVEASVRQAIAALEELGAKPVEVSLPLMKYVGAVRVAAMADSMVTHEPYLESSRDDYGPNVIYRTVAGQFVLGRDYSKALKIQRLIKEEYARVFQQVDFLVSPTSPVPPPRIDSDTMTLDGQQHRVRGPGSGMISHNTYPGNATGLPAITVPCGFTASGLPIGLQLMGRPFEEALLFQAAQAYEQISPTQGKRPPLLG